MREQTASHLHGENSKIVKSLIPKAIKITGCPSKFGKASL